MFINGRSSFLIGQAEQIVHLMKLLSFDLSAEPCSAALRDSRYQHNDHAYCKAVRDRRELL